MMITQKVFQSEKEIKEGIKQVICERITLNEFRELISNLSIIETSAFKKYLREVEYGGLFSYSKVLKALCSFDISYVSFSPITYPNIIITINMIYTFKSNQFQRLHWNSITSKGRASVLHYLPQINQHLSISTILSNN